MAYRPSTARSGWSVPLAGVLLVLFAATAIAVPPYPSQVRLIDGVAMLDPAFTPDGRTAVFLGSTNVKASWRTLYSLDLTEPSAEPVQLEHGGSSDDIDEFQLTADGQDVVFSGERPGPPTGDGVWSVPVDGSAAPTPLAPDDDHLVQRFELHPDGTHVLITSTPEVPYHPYDLWVRRLDGSDEPRRINTRQQQQGAIGGFQLTPDGDHVVYSGDLEVPNRDDVYAAPVFGGGDQVRVHPVGAEDGDVVSYRVAGDHVLVLGDLQTFGRNEIFSTPVDGSEPTQVLTRFEGVGGSIASMEPTPDGTRVVYVGSTDDNGGVHAFVSPVDTSAQRMIATLGDDGSFAHDFLVTPDGTRAVLMTAPEPDQRRDLWSVRLDGQGEPVRLTDAGSFDSVHAVMGRDVSISPDSQRVVWSKERGTSSQQVGVFSAPIDRAGEQVLLSGGDRFVEPVEFELSPDGTRVAFVAREDPRDPDNLHHTPLFSAPIDRADQRVLVSEMVFSDDTGGVFSFGFSPDSATLFYSGNLEGTTERSYASGVGRQPPGEDGDAQQPARLAFADAVLPPDQAGVIVSGDFDGDGVDDLVVVAPGADNDLRWEGTGEEAFLDYGDDAFDIRGSYDLVVPGDFDGDGDTDLWLVDAGPDNDRMLLADGKNSFQNRGSASEDVAGRYDDALVGDFDGDGLDDVWFSSPTADGDRMLASRGANDFVSLGDASLQVRRDYDHHRAADFDGDGRTDVWLSVEGRSDDRLLVAAGDFRFANQGRRSFDVANPYVDVTTADHSGDGRADIALVGDRPGDDRRFNATGTNRFRGFGPTSYRFGAARAFVVAGDYDGDGRVDLFTVGVSGDDHVLTSTGANGFVDHRAGQRSPSPQPGAGQGPSHPTADERSVVHG